MNFRIGNIGSFFIHTFYLFNNYNPISEREEREARVDETTR